VLLGTESFDTFCGPHGNKTPSVVRIWPDLNLVSRKSQKKKRKENSEAKAKRKRHQKHKQNGAQQLMVCTEQLFAVSARAAQTHLREPLPA